MPSQVVNITIRCDITPEAGATHEQVEEQLDRIADTFFGLDDITDQDISYDLGAREVKFTMTFQAEDKLDAVARAHVFVRRAIHDAGGASQVGISTATQSQEDQ